MKISTKRIALKWPLKYKFACLLLVFWVILHSQEISKTFEKEIEVSERVKVMSKGPYSMSFKMNGRIDMKVGSEKFMITPGANDGIAALTIDDYQIFTWLEKRVKQTVQIKIMPDEKAPDEAQELLNQLQMSLEQGANNIVRIDDNMNIESFGFTNGWFTSNESFIILENGRKYRVKSINIKSSLHIPKQSELELSSKYIPTSIGDLDGKMVLRMTSSQLNVGDVDELEANLRFCTASFQSLVDAKITAVNSNVKTGCIENLLIGADELMNRGSVEHSLLAEDDGHSYASKYHLESVENLTIFKTTFDKFFLGQIGRLSSLQSSFSDYKIDGLSKEILLSAQNGDLHIVSVERDFESIKINNEISSILLGMAHSPDYQLNLFSNQYTEYDFPNNLNLLPKLEGWHKSYLMGDQEKAGDINIRCKSCKVTIKD